MLRDYHISDIMMTSYRWKDNSVWFCILSGIYYSSYLCLQEPQAAKGMAVYIRNHALAVERAFFYIYLFSSQKISDF